MEKRDDQQRPPESLAEQRASSELVKLVRKTRWMGLEDEAEKMENQLIQREAAAADSVLAMPSDTD